MVTERLLLHISGDPVPDAVPGVEPGLHRHLGDPGELVQAHHVAEDGDLGMVGDGEVLLDEDAPGPVLLGAGGGRQGLGDGRGLHPGGPQHGADVVAGLLAVVVADQHIALVDVGDDRAHVLLHAQRIQGLGRLLRQFRAEHGQRRAAAVEQQYPGILRFDVPELGAKGLGGDLSDLPGEFHAGRAGADQGEGQVGPAFLRVGGRVRHLERSVHPAPDRERIGDRLHPRCPPGVLGMAEVGLPDSGGDDEVVIAELDAVAADPPGQDAPAGDIKIDDLSHDAVDVLLLPEQVTQRGGDLPLGHDAGGALVEQRLEHVMLSPVDQRHRGVGVPQPADREQAGEAAAHDHHAASPGLVCHRMLRSVAHPAGSCQVSPLGSSRSASFGPQLPRA